MWMESLISDSLDLQTEKNEPAPMPQMTAAYMEVHSSLCRWARWPHRERMTQNMSGKISKRNRRRQRLAGEVPALDAKRAERFFVSAFASFL